MFSIIDLKYKSLLMTQRKLLSFLLCSQLLVTIFGFASEKDKYYENLYYTAKFWGFLKYYHPVVASGQSDWNLELIQQLENLEKCKGQEEVKQFFESWLAELKSPSKCRKCKKQGKKEYDDRNFDLSWIENTSFWGAKLSGQLGYIRDNRYLGEPFYLERKPAGNILLKNENGPESYDWKKKEHRLLTWFQYWNLVEYFFPYKYQCDQDWDEVLKEMTPRFLNVESEEEFHMLLLECFAKTDDSHARFYSEQTVNHFGTKWLPIQFKLIDGKAIVTGFYNDSMAKKDGFHLGDVITHVDGESVQKRFERNKKYLCASNEAVKRRNTISAIFNGDTEEVKLKIERNGQIEESIYKRYSFRDFSYHYHSKRERFKSWEDGLAYVNLGKVSREQVDSLMDSLMHFKGIVFDLRENANSTLYQLSAYLNQEPMPFVVFTKPDLSYPGRLIWTKPYYCGSSKGKKYTGKVMILVNELTQSHGEFSCMCLQTGDRVQVLGSQSSGADGNVNRIKLIGGFETVFSGIGVFYPDRSETQRVGVRRDYSVSPTIKGMQEGRDEQLEEALRILRAE
ncbi:MAG: hypothetical protein EP338_13810 [Bacteroidetes bacterium]|nr:MAG: hypothetical protein EP338_13810 [Bacteroidota bacterium]